MNYGEMKETLQDWAFNDNEDFKRNVPTFVKMGVRDIARDIRIPELEYEVLEKIDQNLRIEIPMDLMELISLRTKDGELIQQTTFKRLREWKDGDKPIFCRHMNMWEFRGFKEDDEIIIYYYYVPTDPQNDTDESEIMFLLPNACLYAGLAHASIYNQDTENIEYYQNLSTLEVQRYMSQVERSEFSTSPILRSGFNPY